MSENKVYMASDYGTLDDDTDYEAFPCTDGVPLASGDETDDDGIVVFKQWNNEGWVVSSIRSKLGSEFDGKTLGSGGWLDYEPAVDDDDIIYSHIATGYWGDDKDSSTFESLTVEDSVHRTYEITLSGKTVSPADGWQWTSECGGETVGHTLSWNDADNQDDARPDCVYLAHVRRI